MPRHYLPRKVSVAFRKLLTLLTDMEQADASGTECLGGDEGECLNPEHRHACAREEEAGTAYCAAGWS